MSETSTSCVGCKFLYGDGSGYSNWTWLDTWVRCARDANPNLCRDEDKPYDWPAQGRDEWPPTRASRCDLFSPGPFITLDPDREDHPSAEAIDQEQADAICKARSLDLRPVSVQP